MGRSEKFRYLNYQALVDTLSANLERDLKLLRAKAAQMAMMPRFIVEAFDIVVQVSHREFPILVNVFLDEHHLQAAEKRLRVSVIPAIAFAVHAGLQMIGVTEASPRIASELRTLVRVNDRATRPSLPNCHE